MYLSVLAIIVRNVTAKVSVLYLKAIVHVNRLNPSKTSHIVFFEVFIISMYLCVLSMHF